MLLILCFHGFALAQHRCTEGGKIVFRETPCTIETSQPRYRCFIDGNVVFGDTPCPKIKTKAQIKAEEERKKDDELKAKRLKAKELEESDKHNTSRRKIQAEAVVLKNLRDPDSARFGQAYVSWLSGSPAVCGVVSARNGFGGYAQPAGYVVIGNVAVIEDSQSPTIFTGFFKEHCAQ